MACVERRHERVHAKVSKFLLITELLRALITILIDYECVNLAAKRTAKLFVQLQNIGSSGARRAKGSFCAA